MNEELQNLLDTLRDDFRDRDLHLSFTSKFYIKEVQVSSEPHYSNETLFLTFSTDTTTDEKVNDLFSYIIENNIDDYGDTTYSIIKSDNATPSSKVSFYATISEASYLNFLRDTDIPTSEDFTVNGSQNTDYVFSVSEFSFSSSYYDYELEGIKIVSLPSTGELYLDNNVDSSIDVGENVIAGQEIGKNDIIKLTLKPLPGQTGSPYDSFTFTVSNGVNYSTTPNTCTINIT